MGLKYVFKLVWLIKNKNKNKNKILCGKQYFLLMFLNFKD